MNAEKFTIILAVLYGSVFGCFFYVRTKKWWHGVAAYIGSIVLLYMFYAFIFGSSIESMDNFSALLKKMKNGLSFICVITSTILTKYITNKFDLI